MIRTKSKVAKKTAKGNVSGTTSLSNNAIQNANDLSRANKHNLRDYDNQRELITTIYGTNDIVEDVKQVYLDEFEEARIEFNNKQTRNDRKINNYFEKACTLQNDIACEIIIELGDMDFCQDKDDEYRFKMIDVYCKKGMKKQVGKSKVFTKESLTAIQDKMRNACIKSYNKFYGVDSRLKAKQKGRNQDINVKEMDNYREIKKRLEQQKQKLENANKRTKKLDNSSKGIIELLDNLKPMPFNKNNSQISNENIENIKDYIKDVTDVTQTVRSVNDLNMSIKDFEHATSKIESEKYSLKEQIGIKDKEINELKDELSVKDKAIIKLSSALETAKTELSKFKWFWKSLIKRFQMKIFDEKYYDIPEDKRSYTLVAEDLEKSGIFDNNDSDIVHNPTRKVLTNDELAEIQAKKGKKKNDYNLN